MERVSVQVVDFEDLTPPAQEFIEAVVSSAVELMKYSPKLVITLLEHSDVMREEWLAILLLLNEKGAFGQNAGENGRAS